ncbi:MAG: FAD-dependent oxidoreductase, partial [Nitrosarchaeum sp.]|nr:FAD-dependent oxidoreductase [Nitrosarchaeum sp.]
MRYDLIVIGAGSGGLNVAMFMARVGLRVLLIDKSDMAIGGDCLNHGCVPS